MVYEQGQLVKCANCKGTGKDTCGVAIVTCRACNGSGYQRVL